MDAYDRMQSELAALEATGNLRELRSMSFSCPGPYLEWEGKRYLNLSSNDYLGLAACPMDLNLELDSLPFMHGAPSSRLMTGNGEDYERLESALRVLFPQKDALVFNSGFAANAGLPAALTRKGDVILADKLMHASAIDGMRLAPAEWKRFTHNDMAALERLLQRHAYAENVWVMVESIYSMDGDLAPLEEIVSLKRRYGFKLYVDEAHAFGLSGPQGQGLCAQLGILDEVDVLLLTFGKAIAGAGAAVICSSLMRRYLINTARSLIFTTALPPITLRWNALVLEAMVQGGELAGRRQKLHRHQERFAAELGLTSVASQIIPIPAGSNERALAMAAAGREAGIWLCAIRPPTVPQGEARIRLSLTAGLSDDHLSQLIDLCKKLG